jgi:hypothetical protein
MEIYSSLRRGDIDAWARPNGSGDFVKITPMQWAGLRFRAFGGHDIAVPVDSEQNPLLLPRPLADYLSGSVPATETPTVWPDPEFSAKQALELWLPSPAVQVSQAPPPITPLRESCATALWEPEPPPTPRAQQTRRRGRPPKKRDEVEQAMRAAYAGRYAELHTRTEETLCVEFNASRTTIRNARARITS